MRNALKHQVYESTEPSAAASLGGLPSVGACPNLVRFGMSHEQRLRTSKIRACKLLLFVYRLGFIIDDLTFTKLEKANSEVLIIPLKSIRRALQVYVEKSTLPMFRIRRFTST